MKQCTAELLVALDLIGDARKSHQTIALQLRQRMGYRAYHCSLVLASMWLPHAKLVTVLLTI